MEEILPDWLRHVSKKPLLFDFTNSVMEGANAFTGPAEAMYSSPKGTAQ
jgi:hypothetical protein